jgi:hypothetical protein
MYIHIQNIRVKTLRVAASSPDQTGLTSRLAAGPARFDLPTVDAVPGNRQGIWRVGVTPIATDLDPMRESTIALVIDR